MSKIVRTFPVLEKTASTNKLVNEIASLHKLATAMKAAKDAFTANKKPADELPDRPTQGIDLHGTKAIDRIVSELFSDTGTERRLVIFTSLNNLKSMYLKSGGGHGLIDSFDPKDLAEFQTNPVFVRGPLVFLKKDFTFDQMTVPRKGQADVAIQIDVPVPLWQQLQQAKSEEEIKNVLTKMMSHKYYVMTLSTRKAHAIRPAMGTANGTEERAEAFDPNIIVNYPNKTILNLAIAEWDDKKEAPEKEKEAAVVSKEKEAKRKHREDEADEILQGDQDKVRQQILNIVMSAEDSTKAAEAVLGQYKDRYSRDEIAGILLSLHRKLDSKKLKDTAYKIKPSPAA